MTLSTKFTLEQDQFISDLPINIEYYLTHLGAPTGCGKTTFIIEELAKKSKVLMLCPVNVQVAQLAHDFKDDPRVQCLTANDTSNSLDADVIVYTTNYNNSLTQAFTFLNTRWLSMKLIKYIRLQAIVNRL